MNIPMPNRVTAQEKELWPGILRGIPHGLQLIFVCLLCCGICRAQHLYQRPKQLKDKDYLATIIGPLPKTAHAEESRILWVYGKRDHGPGAHEYEKVKDLMSGMLRSVPGIGVEEVFHFPTERQLEGADLVVLYLHLPQLEAGQFRALQSYIRKGGGLVTLHESAIMRPAAEGKKLATCLGFAWNEGTSKWGAIFDSVSVNTRHPIFEGFPGKLQVVDEFYWDLYREKGVRVLGSVRTGPEGDSSGPIPQEQLSTNTAPVFWTYQPGKGRVFGTTAGHNLFTFYDPEFRIVLFRAIAWALQKKPAPFMPLVFEGITSPDGKVGVTNTMRE